MAVDLALMWYTGTRTEKKKVAIYDYNHVATDLQSGEPDFCNECLL